MDIKLLGKRTLKWGYEHLDTICALLSSGCAIAGSVEAAKAGCISARMIDNAWYDKMKETGDESDLTFKEKLFLTWKNYRLSAGFTAASIICTFGVKGAGMSKLAMANAAYSVLASKVSEYEKLREATPIKEKEKGEKIEETRIIEGYLTIYEPYSQQYIKTTKEELLWAEIAINKEFNSVTYVSLNKMLSMFKHANRCPYGDEIGWAIGSDKWDWNWSFHSGSPWINLGITKTEVDGEFVMGMTYSIEPDSIEEFF